MDLYPEFNIVTEHFFADPRHELTRVFVARLLEGDTYIFLDSREGEVSLMNREELTSRIKRLVERGKHGSTVPPMGEGSVGGT